jgi:membrane protein required for beta-lactamase induction
MTEELPHAVQLAVLEKAHRQAIEDVMQSDLGDVERVARILAMEAEHLGLMESLRAAWLNGAASRQDDSDA